MKELFYVPSDADGRRCEEAFRSRVRISISGCDAVSNQIRPYTGYVISVEYISGASTGRQWKVGIETDEIAN